MVREPLAATATKGAAYYLSCMEVGRYGGWSNETIPHPKQIGGGVHSTYLTLSKGAYLIDTLKGNSSTDGGENIKGVFPLCKGEQILNEAQEENSSKVVTGVYTTTIQEGKFSLLYFLL